SLPEHHLRDRSQFAVSVPAWGIRNHPNQIQAEGDCTEMITGKSLPRRTFLRGVGTAVALPFLDAMAPAFAAGRLPGKAPVRMAFVYVPNGIMMDGWNPDYD